MSDKISTDICRKCQSPAPDAFCPKCGHPADPPRISGSFLLAELKSILNFDKGILFTIKELILRPGENVRAFIREDRNRLVKPLVFIIVCSLLYTVFQQWLRFEDGYVNYSLEDGSAVSAIFSWITDNYGYSNIIMSLFIAGWIRLFFRKYGYNIFEIIILLCYMMGMGMLFFALVGVLETLIGWGQLDKGFLVAILYLSWGIGQFFEKRLMNYLKAFLSYMTGMTTFALAAVALGIAIDYLESFWL